MIVIILYVDDLVIGGEHLFDINKVKSLRSDKFEMTDMKELHYFLGIEADSYRDNDFPTALHPQLVIQVRDD